MKKEFVTKMPTRTTIYLEDNKIRIKRKGFINFLYHGFQGEKTIPLKSITSIQIKKPGLLSGYIQFGVKGGIESKRGLKEANRDENTVMFIFPKPYKAMLELKKYIEEYIINEGRDGSPFTVADELHKLKQLLDVGVISQEEFDKQKNKLLE